MAFSYNSDLLTNLDLIRFKLGDTVDKGHYLEDGEINSILLTATFNKTLIECCSAIVAKLAAKVTYAIGPEKVNLSDAFDHYNSLLTNLQTKYSNSTSVPAPKLPNPTFYIGMHDVRKT